MDRKEWLAERRAAVKQDYTRDASKYDDEYDPVTPFQVKLFPDLGRNGYLALCLY